MIGDRGITTFARIAALEELSGLDWVAALKALSIKALAADGTCKPRELFEATDAELLKIAGAAEADRIRGAGKVGVVPAR